MSNNKHILVHLTHSNDKLFVEGLQAALVLASFEHDVQLCLSVDTQKYLFMPESKAGKMLKSLEFYDMPSPWLLCGHERTDEDVFEDGGFKVISLINTDGFDHIISF